MGADPLTAARSIIEFLRSWTLPWLFNSATAGCHLCRQMEKAIVDDASNRTRRFRGSGGVRHSTGAEASRSGVQSVLLALARLGAIARGDITNVSGLSDSIPRSENLWNCRRAALLLMAAMVTSTPPWHHRRPQDQTSPSMSRQLAPKRHSSLSRDRRKAATTPSASTPAASPIWGNGRSPYWRAATPSASTPAASSWEHWYQPCGRGIR